MTEAIPGTKHSFALKLANEAKGVYDSPTKRRARQIYKKLIGKKKMFLREDCATSFQDYRKAEFTSFQDYWKDSEHIALTNNILMLHKKSPPEGRLLRLSFQFTLLNPHLVNQILRTKVFVDNQQHVADIDSDALLQLGLEGDVATHCLPVAVEGEADEFAAGVHNGAARVTAGNVVIGCEAGV